MDGEMEKGEIMQEVSPSVDYGMAICHYQIIIPPRDKQIWRLHVDPGVFMLKWRR